MDDNELILQLKDVAKLQIGMWHKENEEIIEKAITVITELLVKIDEVERERDEARRDCAVAERNHMDEVERREAAEARANDAERVLYGMVADYFRVNEMAKKILDYARNDGTPVDMKDDLYNAAIMLFRVDESHRREEQAAEIAKNAEERAEKAEAYRDVVVSDFEEYVRGGEEACKYCEYDEDCEPGETKCGALRRDNFKYGNKKGLV